jgi:hypothetical protein
MYIQYHDILFKTILNHGTDYIVLKRFYCTDHWVLSAVLVFTMTYGCAADDKSPIWVAETNQPGLTERFGPNGGTVGQVRVNMATPYSRGIPRDTSVTPYKIQFEEFATIFFKQS